MEALKIIAMLLIWSLAYDKKPVALASTVAIDGSGTFKTINEAIQAAPNFSSKSHIINIKKGVYNEHVIVGKEKQNIVLIGEGMDSTIITGKRSVTSGFSLPDTATVAILGDNFMAKGISFENAAGPNGAQAVALLADAHNLTFFQCRAMGYQDTLYTRFGRMFFRECEILGTIDFIFGDSSSVFQNCIIHARRPLPNQYIAITAQGRLKKSTNTGFMFQNTTINTDEVNRFNTHVRCYLGRPWKDFSRVVFIKSSMDAGIDPAGWIQWENKPPVHPYFAEYENRGPGANTSNRAVWSIKITRTLEASRFSVRNFINGDAWIPPAVPHFLDI